MHFVQENNILNTFKLSWPLVLYIINKLLYKKIIE